MSENDVLTLGKENMQYDYLILTDYKKYLAWDSFPWQGRAVQVKLNKLLQYSYQCRILNYGAVW